MDTTCFDFVNSEHHDHCGAGPTEDRLQDPLWLDQFLGRWELEVSRTPDPATMAEMLALRRLLREMIERFVDGQSACDEDLGVLNGYLERAAVRRRVTSVDGGISLVLAPVRRDWSWVLSQVAASFAGVLVERDPTRLRICDNPDCQWVFYDETKCRQMRWCADSCANLMKVRRFRSRQRSAAEPVVES